MLKKIFLLIGILSLTTSLSAETIKMKSGKIIGGKILERTDEYIKVDIGIGVDITYFLDEIESIDGKAILTDAEIKPLVLQSEIPGTQLKPEIKSNIYINEEYGISITTPKGWFDRKEKPPGTLVFYTKEPGPATPAFSVLIGVLPSQVETPLDFAEYMLTTLESQMKIKVVMQPKEIKLNDINGAKLIFEDIEKSWRSECYFFIIKNEKGITLIATDRTDNFENNRQEFQETINSFQIK